MLVLPQKLPPMFPFLCCKLLISYKFNALHMESKDNELHGNDSGDLDLRARIISELCGQRLLDERLLTFPHAMFAAPRQSCVYSRTCVPATFLTTDPFDEDLYLLPRHGNQLGMTTPQPNPRKPLHPLI